jgi:selenium metabolism protein YedF
MTDEKTLDCRGLACPQPVLNTRSALQAGDSPFVVLVDNESSCTNVRRFAESQGARVAVEQQGDDYRLVIQPGRPAPAVEAPLPACEIAAPRRRDLVVYVSSEGMGRGDDELGATLMAAFLDTLAHLKDEISHAIFVNGGARLAVAGSPVLEELLQLEQLGVQVLVCGTCLNHFGVKDKLAVGSVSNMYAIIETLAAAGRVIRP